MKPLYTYLTNDTVHKLSKSERKKLLEIDSLYRELYTDYWNKWYDSGVINQKQEFKKFIDAKKNGDKYYPQLEISLHYLDKTFLDRCRILRTKCEQFKCFLSKYYIGKIDEMYCQANWAINPSKETMYELNNFLCINISDDVYEEAMKMLKEHPWEDVSDEQTMDGPDVVPQLQQHIKKLGYEYDAVLNDTLLARMKVLPNRPELQIKTSAKYSPIDVGSLKVHEVEVHCGRRYYGMQQGLYLMLDGLPGRNTLDEGMAIYNSIHMNPLGIKPNLFWKVAIKIYIAKHIDKDFHELYEDIEKMCPTVPKLEIFENLLRFKRMLKDCSLPGGDCMIQSDYFIGYQMIKNMDKKLRNDILHYNIGPNQIKDLDKIKKFFKLNKFKPITKKDMLK